MDVFLMHKENIYNNEKLKKKKKKKKTLIN